MDEDDAEGRTTHRQTGSGPLPGATADDGTGRYRSSHGRLRAPRAARRGLRYVRSGAGNACHVDRSLVHKRRLQHPLPRDEAGRRLGVSVGPTPEPPQRPGALPSASGRDYARRGRVVAGRLPGGDPTGTRRDRGPHRTALAPLTRSERKPTHSGVGGCQS